MMALVENIQDASPLADSGLELANTRVATCSAMAVEGPHHEPLSFGPRPSASP